MYSSLDRDFKDVVDTDGTGASVKRKREGCTVRGAVSGTCHGDGKGHRGQDTHVIEEHNNKSKKSRQLLGEMEGVFVFILTDKARDVELRGIHK